MNSEIKADPGTPVAAPAKPAEESALHPPKPGASGADRSQGRGGNHNSNRGGQRGGRGSPGAQPRGNIRGGRGGNFRGGNFRGGRGGGGNARDGLGGGDFEGMGFGRSGGNFVRGRGGGGMGGNRYVDKVSEKLKAFEGQSTVDLPPLDMSEKKFNGRARLYVGNFSIDTTEEQIKELVSQHGEVGEVFFNREKMFAFLRMATRMEAEKAKRGLDGQMKNGRPLKVRFAPHQGALKVSNLGPWVSNELLHKAFSIFGDIERCVVHVDERGKPKGDGFVEFERKPCALEALKRCGNGCFFLTSSLRPVVAELVEDAEDEDGLQEKMIPKRNNDYHTERETGPRFAAQGSFEFEYGNKWKALYELKKQKVEALEREMKLEEDKLVAQMEFARYEHETEHLRDQLRQREANRETQKTRFEMKERQMEDMMKQEQERRQREEEDMMNRMQQQESSMRQKQQDNSLFIQAQELNEMLDQQEAAIGGDNMSFRGGRGGGFFGGPGRGGFGEGGFGSFGGFGEGFGGGRWNNDDGPGGKRRRF